MWQVLLALLLQFLRLFADFRAQKPARDVAQLRDDLAQLPPDLVDQRLRQRWQRGEDAE